MTRPLLLRLLGQRLARPISSRPSSPFPSSRFEFGIPPSRPRRTGLVGARSYASGRRSGQSPFRVWPFVAITLAGTGAYVLMVRTRVDMAPAVDKVTANPQLAAPAKDTPSFSPENVTVLFVLGGPGAGKGTQCANLVRDYHFTHLSAGDLLREEQERPGSEFGELIKDYIKNGAIVPMEVTVQLLENAVTASLQKAQPSSSANLSQAKGKFLIDGFPRKMDQALKFEEAVCPARFVLFFDCPEAELQRRLLKRGETSGRSDDNVESIRKRFRTFEDTSMPVVQYYERQGRVVRIPATGSKEEVYALTKKSIDERLGKDF